MEVGVGEAETERGVMEAEMTGRWRGTAVAETATAVAEAAAAAEAAKAEDAANVVASSKTRSAGKLAAGLG